MRDRTSAAAAAAPAAPAAPAGRAMTGMVLYYIFDDDVAGEVICGWSVQQSDILAAGLFVCEGVIPVYVRACDVSVGLCVCTRECGRPFTSSARSLVLRRSVHFVKGRVAGRGGGLNRFEHNADCFVVCLCVCVLCGFCTRSESCVSSWNDKDLILDKIRISRSTTIYFCMRSILKYRNYL